MVCDTEDGRSRRTSSSGRMLSMFDLFTPQRPLLSAEEIAGALECSPATAYRYARDLCAAGLLARFSTGFTLGPRIIELDYTIREHDPLLRLGMPVLRELRERTGCDVLMTKMYGEQIIAVHHERGTDPTTVSFSRGRPMPLFYGAGSKVILANLPTAQQRRLHGRYEAEIDTAGLGSDWPEFRSSLAKIRKAGHAVSIGELERQNVGLGVPVMHEPDLLPSGLIAVMHRTRWEMVDKRLITDIVMKAAAAVGALIKGT